MRGINAVRGAVGVVLLIAAVTLVLHLSTTDLEFSRYNPGWNGTSTVFGTFEERGVVMIRDPAELAGQTEETLLVVAPGRPPTGDEAETIRAFVASGNTLVLADDFGAGNALLEAVGASIRLDQRNLSSVEREHEIAASPRGFPVPGHPLSASLSMVIFDHPVAVTGGAPFLASSRLSWIDQDGNGRPDAGEPLERYPLAADEAVGAGRVVVIGDASLFINAMQNLRNGDNNLLLERLTAGNLLVDQRLSRTADATRPISTILWVQERPSIIIAVTALALVALAWQLNRRRE